MSTITADEFFDSIHRIVSLLDEENIAILRTMKQHGPRNLLGIARKAKLPYTTVYNRVTKLESQGVLRTWIQPNCPKIGLSRAVVLATPHPGKEVFTREALKIPGFWLRVARCIGDCNGYYSLHGIPTASRQEFELYLAQLLERGLLKNYRIYWIGDTKFPLTNFDYYKPKDKTWKFDWKGWLDSFVTSRAKPDTSKQSSQPVSFDKKDLIILKELALDARVTLADLSKQLGMTLPATKYRFDRLVKEGYVADYVIMVLPFVPEVSDLCEIRLDLTNETYMKNAEKVLAKTPLVLTITPVLGLHSLAVRIYLPRQETTHLMNFLSSLARKEVLAGYSFIQLDPTTQLSQTFAFKYYSDDSGWQYDNREYLQGITSLVSKWSKPEPEQATIEATVPPAVQ